MSCRPRCARGRSTSGSRSAASCGRWRSAARCSCSRSPSPTCRCASRSCSRWRSSILLVLFASLGVIVGVYAETWDQAGFVNNIVILPLSFLGGVFYSVDLLPSPWQEISHVNPIFFLINAIRYGFLGTSDVPVAIALAVTAALALACVAWSATMFRSGRRLKA